MKTIDELVAAAPALADMDPAQLELISRCGQNRVVKAGEYLMREGDRADAFYVLRRGTAAIEVHSPNHGALPIETLHDGDLVGWSWLIEPYRVHFDVRTLSECHLVAFDGACLRARFEQDPALGYDLLRRFLPVIVERLQATRLRLLDLYGN